MRTQPSNRPFIVLVLIVCHAMSGSGHAEAPATVLEKLRDADNLWRDGCTMAYTMLEPRPLTDTGETELLPYHGVVTGSNGIWAAISVLDPDAPPPVYRPPSGVPGQLEANQADRNAVRVSRTTSRVSLSGPDYWGTLIHWAGITVGPAGVLRDDTRSLPEDRRGRTTFRKAGTPIDSQCVYIPLLVSGRGYSFLLQEITDVAQGGADGYIECTGIGKAPGFGPSAKSGIWWLAIDPTAGYLVRRARYSTTPDSIYIEVDNKGIRGTGDAALPRNGYIMFLPGVLNGENARHELTFEKLAPEVDNGVFAEAREQLFPNMPSEARVFDWYAG